MTVFPGEVVGMVISDWERSADGQKLFLTVKDGVDFHDGWGPFTAEDLAWNLTDTNATTNPESISWNAGDYGALFNSHTAIDDNTVEIEINQWDVRWAANQLNSQGQTMEIFSKKAFDEKGRDWMLENIIGTGPFQAIEYRDDERIIADAVENHHRQTAMIDQIIYIEVPEAATRKAMMLTGEVDGADLILPDRKDLAERGFIWVPANSGKEQVVIFGGNYWETERNRHQRTVGAVESCRLRDGPALDRLSLGGHVPLRGHEQPRWHERHGTGPTGPLGDGDGV